MFRTGLFVAASLVVIACGTSSSSPGRSDGDGGSGGTSEPSPTACSAPNAFLIWGKPYDAERDCIDTEHPIEGVACTLKPQEGDDPYYSDGFTCLQRKTNGDQVWVFAYNRVGFDEAIWDRCPNAPLIAPKGCYAAGCERAPRSTCSLEKTRAEFKCGGESEYDENCCSRADCETDGDCSEGEVCTQVMTLGQWYCWDNPGNPCDCGGPRFAAPARKCVAKP